MTFHERRKAQATPAGPPPRFKVGDQARVLGGTRLVTIAAVVPGKHTNRYRVEGGKYMHFEDDLGTVPA